MLKVIGWIMYAMPILVITGIAAKDFYETEFYKDFEEKDKRNMVTTYIVSFMVVIVISLLNITAGYLVFTK